MHSPYLAKENAVKRTYWLIVLGLSILTAGTASYLSTAQARTASEGSRWEYAWMYLPAEGSPVFSQAEREVTVFPSSESLSGAVDSIQQGPRHYKLQTRSVRDDSAAALDIAGQDGWEAVSAVPYRGGIRVLLRRPA